MGTQVILKNKSFRHLGWPSTNHAIRYADLGGIEDSPRREALKTLYASLREAGLWTKLDGLYVFTGTAADGLNFKTLAHPLIFNNGHADAHTQALGYQPSAALGRYASTPVGLVQVDVNDVHVHVYNTTLESSGAGENKVLLSASRTTDYLVKLNRNQSNRTRIYAGTYNTTSLTNTELSTQLTGLVSGVRRRTAPDATELALYASGVQRATRSEGLMSTALSSPAGFHIGHQNGANITDCALRAVAWGYHPWTSSDEARLNTILEAFHAALIV